MTEQFEMPAPPSTNIDFNDLLGSLVLVKVIAYEEHIPNAFTEPGQKTPAARADFTVIDGPRAGTEYLNALVFPRVLRGQLQRSVGKTLLGRMRQGEAKKGQNAPWVLEGATPADVSAAQQFLANRQPSQGYGGQQPQQHQQPAQPPMMPSSGQPPF